MYLFSRRRRANPGQARAAVAMAIDSANRVNQITGLQVRPWSAVFSPEFGTIVWATFVEHLEDLETATDKLMADSSFGDFIEQSADLFTGPAEDSLMQVVHGEPRRDRPAYVATVRAECANGSIGAAMAGGVEIAEMATRITGTPTMFASGVTGPYAGVGWFTAAPDLGTLERNNAALMADATWLETIDRVGPLFLSTTASTLFRALA
jgi:hypothetical protein